MTKSISFKETTYTQSINLYSKEEFCENYTRYVTPIVNRHHLTAIDENRAIRIIKIRSGQEFMKNFCRTIAAAFVVAAIATFVLVTATVGIVTGLVGPLATFLSLVLLMFVFQYLHNKLTEKELASVVQQLKTPVNS